MKSNPVIKIEYSGKEPASSRANYRKKDRIVDPGFPVDPMGYWNPANIGQIVQVPTEDGNISMEGVNQDLIGMDEYGNTQYQEVGKKYKYRGKFITEYPIAKNGGWLDTMQKGGINMSKVRMDFHPKSQIEAEDQIKKGLINTKRRVDKNGDDEGENLFEIFDPTGISSWNDVYNEYKRTGLSSQTTLEAIGAIPLAGKLAKFLKNAPKVFKGFQGYEKINQNRHMIGNLLDKRFKEVYI